VGQVKFQPCENIHSTDGRQDSLLGTECNCNHNRNLQTSKVPLDSQSQGTSFSRALFQVQ